MIFKNYFKIKINYNNKKVSVNVYYFKQQKNNKYLKIPKSIIIINSEVKLKIFRMK